MVRLTSLSVTGLLGRFDHNVTFPDGWEFVILHGPNGVGKTKLLELVTAISAGRLHTLFIIPFDSAILGFSDGTRLTIVRASQLAIETVGPNDEPDRLQVTLVRPSKEYVRFLITR